MITFSKFGKHGNLGNQLHQLASLIGFSEKYHCELVLPEWKYAAYFNGFPEQAIIKTDLLVEEPYYHFTPEFWDQYATEFQTQNADILGWLQTEKYWQHCKKKVHEALSFKQEFLHKTKEKFSKAFTKTTIAISIRRGDFVTDPNHFLLPLNFYLNALVEYFPHYKDHNILVFSDDMDYCKAEIKSLPNIFFAFGLNGIEQLCLMSLCDHFIISNSTFSWWGAMLGEKQYSTIIRSPYYVEGELKAKLNIKDYYPERWISYDHVGKSNDPGRLRYSYLSRLFTGLKSKSKSVRKSIYHKMLSKISKK